MFNNLVTFHTIIDSIDYGTGVSGKKKFIWFFYDSSYVDGTGVLG